MSQQPEEILQDFILYNDPITNEIKETAPEVFKAYTEVIGKLFEEFIGVSVIPATETSPRQESLYKIGDEVETMSGEFEGVGVIKTVEYSEIENEFVYGVVPVGKRKRIKQLEANLYTPQEQETTEETEFSNFTVKELKEIIEENKETIELLDPEDEGDVGEIEKLKEEIDAYEMEIDNRK